MGKKSKPPRVDKNCCVLCPADNECKCIIQMHYSISKTMSRMIMQALPEIIKKKESTLKFANVSDLMFHYIQGDLGQDKKFIYYLEKIADDQLTVLEEFNTLNSSKLLLELRLFLLVDGCTVFSAAAAASACLLVHGLTFDLLNDLIGICLQTLVISI